VEAGGIANESDQGCGSQKADAGDGSQACGGGQAAGEGIELALDIADSLLELTDLAGGREKTGVKRIGYGAGGIREGGCEAGDDVAGALRDRNSHLSQQAPDASPRSVLSRRT
jgi:hypothetical protein